MGMPMPELLKCPGPSFVPRGSSGMIRPTAADNKQSTFPKAFLQPVIYTIESSYIYNEGGCSPNKCRREDERYYLPCGVRP